MAHAPPPWDYPDFAGYLYRIHRDRIQSGWPKLIAITSIDRDKETFCFYVQHPDTLKEVPVMLCLGDRMPPPYKDALRAFEMRERAFKTRDA